MIKSLIYFDEVDLADWPVIIDHPTLKWVDVRMQIEKVVMNYVRSESEGHTGSAGINS